MLDKEFEFYPEFSSLPMKGFKQAGVKVLFVLVFFKLHCCHTVPLGCSKPGSEKLILEALGFTR